MAKGSVRKKGRKWYYRFYIEDESGRQVQKEFAGTESKSETEALLRKAMEDYEAKRFVGKAENITVGEMLDLWIEEDLKPSSLSNGTVMAYTAAVKKIKKYPIGSRRLKTVTADHLQAFLDFMSYGGTNPDGTTSPPMSKGYMLQFSAVLQGAFRFAVFPKRLITFNPMQYIRLRGRKEEADIFCGEEAEAVSRPTITHGQYLKLTGYLKDRKNPALLPVQIAYYTGLRIGEVCGQLCALPCAGQLVGQEDAQHFVPGGSGFQIELLEQLRAGLAGGGQLAAGCQMGIVFAGGHVDAVPQDGAVLQRHVQGDHGHAQLLRLGGQDVAGGIGEDTDHNNTSGLPVKYSIYDAFIKKVGNHYTTI